MLRKLKSLLIYTLAVPGFSWSQTPLQSPESFLGYPLGSRYTRHHQIVEYFRHVASAKPAQVVLQTYGQTNEGRPLTLAFVSAPENIQSLEKIRQNNLLMAGISKNGRPEEGLPVIVWLSYNVHGNEPSSSEAAMQTLYQLLNGTDPRTAEWMKKALIIMDPCINPDGRDRYANWQNSVAGSKSDPDPQTREHREPWPGGRVNHYYFDLNRDWAWQIQKESQQRMKVYNQWMPQVHVDFHEQSPNSPYYFAPAAEPYHDVITPWQREFQRLIGRNNASYFDRQGWLFFTRERFDLFYPSYGDTYPVYNGAIGMTYEQGGGSRAGTSVVLSDSDTLTLQSRLTHHVTTGLSTIEVSVREASRLKNEFQKFFADAVAEPAMGTTRYYVIRKSGSPAGHLQKLCAMLDKNGIAYGHTASASTARGFRYLTGKEEPCQIAADDIIIPVQQPKGVLLRVMFEPESRLTDSATYDITAWAIPYAMGVDAYALRDKTVLTLAMHTPSSASRAFTPVDDATAYVIPWTDMKSAELLSALLNARIQMRYTLAPIRIDGQSIARGSLIATRAANRMSGRQLGEKIAAALQSVNDFPHDIIPIKTGLAEEGHDLGSGDVRPIRRPKVALIAGEGVVANGFGEIWHYFDQEIHYPASIILATDLTSVKMEALDVIILPDGNYRFLSDKGQADMIREWIRKGGKLIAMENAAIQLAGLDWGLRLKKDEQANKGKSDTLAIRKYGDRERESLKGSIPGAIYKVDLDDTHPLAFGYKGQYFTLRQDANLYEYLKDGWNVGTISRNAHVAGFAGVKVKERLKDGMLMGVLPMGAGSIITIADDIVFRGFWENGKLMFANAIFLAGQ